jgi:hypothetical protein
MDTHMGSRIQLVFSVFGINISVLYISRLRHAVDGEKVVTACLW